MFSLVASLKRLSLPVVLSVITVHAAHAQSAAAPPAGEAAPTATAPSATANKPLTQKELAAERKKQEAERKEEEKSPTIRVLPDGLDPNPPSQEDLKAQKLTWKGEYQATKDGQPVLGPDARPIPVLYNEKHKRVKSKVKPLHAHQLEVVAGTLTVDGWTGKAHLNYDIPGQDFIYVSSPSFGTVILSQTAFPGAREQKQALDGKTLTIHVNDHDVQLASDKPLAGKKPESIWMHLDPEYRQDPRYPVMGYGAVTKPPYAWPGAKVAETKGSKAAPPLPASMMPTMVSTICIAQPGKPCVPTAKPMPARKTAASEEAVAPAPQHQ